MKSLTQLQQYYPTAKVVRVRLGILKIYQKRYFVEDRHYKESEIKGLIEKRKNELVREVIWKKAHQYEGIDYKWSQSTNSLYFWVDDKYCRVSDHEHPKNKHFFIDIIIN